MLRLVLKKNVYISLVKSKSRSKIFYLPTGATTTGAGTTTTGITAGVTIAGVTMTAAAKKRKLLVSR